MICEPIDYILVSHSYVRYTCAMHFHILCTTYANCHAHHVQDSFASNLLMDQSNAYAIS